MKREVFGPRQRSTSKSLWPRPPCKISSKSSSRTDPSGTATRAIGRPGGIDDEPWSAGERISRPEQSMAVGVPDCKAFTQTLSSESVNNRVGEGTESVPRLHSSPR